MSRPVPELVQLAEEELKVGKGNYTDLGATGSNTCQTCGKGYGRWWMS
jgi:hypothetical protein